MTEIDESAVEELERMIGDYKRALMVLTVSDRYLARTLVADIDKCKDSIRIELGL